MIHHFKYFNFSHGSFFGVLLLVGIFEFFDGYKIFLLNVSTLQNHSVRSLSNSRENLVFLHYILFLYLTIYSLFYYKIIDMWQKEKKFCKPRLKFLLFDKFYLLCANFTQKSLIVLIKITNECHEVNFVELNTIWRISILQRFSSIKRIYLFSNLLISIS